MNVFPTILEENEFYKMGDHKSIICHLEKQKSSKIASVKELKLYLLPIICMRIIYVFVYIYIYVYLHVSVCIYIYMHIYMYRYIYI